MCFVRKRLEQFLLVCASHPSLSVPGLINYTLKQKVRGNADHLREPGDAEENLDKWEEVRAESGFWILPRSGRPRGGAQPTQGFHDQQ